MGTCSLNFSFLKVRIRTKKFDLWDFLKNFKMLANFFHNTERSIIFFGSCLGSLKLPKKFGEEMVTELVLIWLFGDHHSQKMDQPQKIGKNSEKTAKNRRN